MAESKSSSLLSQGWFWGILAVGLVVLFVAIFDFLAIRKSRKTSSLRPTIEIEESLGKRQTFAEKGAKEAFAEEGKGPQKSTPNPVFEETFGPETLVQIEDLLSRKTGLPRVRRLLCNLKGVSSLTPKEDARLKQLEADYKNQKGTDKLNCSKKSIQWVE